MSAIGGVTYLRTLAVGLSDPNITNPKAPAASNTVYRVLITDADSCQDSVTVDVTIANKPAATVAGNTGQTGQFTLHVTNGSFSISYSDGGAIYNRNRVIDKTKLKQQV